MPSLSLSFLGPLRIEHHSSPVEVSTRKAIALLAYLAVTAETQSRETLAALLWPQSDQKRARGSLRYTLSALRKELGAAWLVSDRQSVGLNWEAGIRVDVVDFHRLLGKDILDAAAVRDASLAALEEAVALYRGDFLAGFTLPDSAAFDEWQLFEAEEARRKLAQALEMLVAAHRARGGLEPALAHARRWVALDEWHEPAHYQLMALYALAGQPGAAVRQYEACTGALQAGLGIRPSAATTTLYQQIRAGELSPPPTRQPQTAVGDAPPSTKVLHPRHNLPALHKPFVNREQERTDIAGLLDDPHCRLLTITGPGGIGKTRLAVQTVGERLPQLAREVRYINLAPLDSADFLVSTIADSLELSFSGLREPQEELLDHLSRNQLLLVLDNFEHLLQKGVTLISVILARAPGTKIIVTSREALNLQEEWCYTLKGLHVPDRSVSATATRSPAVQLFAQHARRARHDFSLTAEMTHVARVCRLVEGMPLGIELAASWVKLLPCREIAAEIQRNLDFLTTSHRDVEARHRSIRAVLEHSWRTLSPAEQQALARLAVFRGGFTREAAAEVAGASLFTLISLFNKSLLQRTAEERYDLHELLRHFAGEKLAAAPHQRKAVQEGHALYYGTMLAPENLRWEGQDEAHSVALVQAEIQNVRTGWRWAARQRKTAVIDHYLDTLYSFYAKTNRYQEGKEAFALAVRHLSDSEQPDDLVLARLLARLGEFYYELGQPETAVVHLQKSLALLQSTSQQHEISFVFKLLGTVYYHRGHYAEARHHLRQSLATGETVDDVSHVANTYLLLGAVSFATGAYDEAQKWQQESLRLYREAEQLWGIAHALRHLGMTAQVLGAYEKAERYYHQSLVLFQEAGNPVGIALSMNHLGQLAQTLDDYQKAKEQYRQSLVICQDNRLQIAMARTLNSLGDVCCQLAEYEEAKGYLHVALETAMAMQAMPLALHSLLHVATLLTKMKDPPLLQTMPAETAVLNSGAAQALELLYLVAHHPASDQETRQRARSSLSQLATQLPADVVEFLQEKAQAQQLESVVVQMLGSGDPQSQPLA